jgi:hypothetical protein
MNQNTIISLLLLLSVCSCTKKQQNDPDPETWCNVSCNELPAYAVFENYPSEKRDSLTIWRYKPNGNFDSLIDVHDNELIRNTAMLRTPLYSGYDYKMVCFGQTDTFKVHHIVSTPFVKEVRCDNNDTGKCYYQITSMIVNGDTLEPKLLSELESRVYFK